MCSQDNQQPSRDSLDFHNMIADRLRAGISAEVWYPASVHRDVRQATLIEDIQEAMAIAAAILSRDPREPAIDSTHKSATLYACPDCAWRGTPDEIAGLLHLRHIDQRINAGELVPAGTCPECKGLIEVDDRDVPQATLDACLRILGERGIAVINLAPLFYVRDADGDQDLLVRADTAVDALVEWRKHFELDSAEEPNYVGEVPLNTSGAIPWDAITKKALQFKPMVQ